MNQNELLDMHPVTGVINLFLVTCLSAIALRFELAQVVTLTDLFITFIIKSIPILTFYLTFKVRIDRFIKSIFKKS